MPGGVAGRGVVAMAMALGVALALVGYAQQGASGGGASPEPSAAMSAGPGAAASSEGYADPAMGGESPSSTAAGQSNAAQSLAMTVTVNGQSFPATIEDTEAGRELAARLPLTLDMSELNGVEKYSYTGASFGGEAGAPATIAAGDIMAYSGDCLVLFYADHPNPGYSYVPLARIDDPDGLAEAAGSGAASVTLDVRS